MSGHAGRPLTIDDAWPVAPGSVEIEAGARYLRDAPLHHFDVPLGLAYGVVDRLELGVGFGGLIHEIQESASGSGNRSGLGDQGKQ